MLDLLIKNGVLLDPETGRQAAGAVGVKDGVICFKGKGEDLNAPEAERVIDADGAYIFPGWIDAHTHLFTGGSGFGVNADLLFPSGAVAAVDMGTAGTANFEAFYMTDMLPRTMDVRAFINLSPVGQPGAGIFEPLGEKAVDEGKIKALAEKYRERILGIKVRISREIVGSLGLSPLAQAVEIGERLGLPVCVHTTNPPEDPGRIVSMLRPGDIYSHMYHHKGMTILDGSGSVKEEFFRAAERGVFLELGNGRMNFSFRVAKSAMEQGLFPDIISSDATARTFANAPDMKDLSYVASKLWNMGMPLHKVIRAVTETPARALGLSETYGRLEEGRPAHITVARVMEKPVRFVDSEKGSFSGSRLLSPELAVSCGRILYMQGRCGFAV